MPRSKWPLVLMALLAAAVVIASCGSRIVRRATATPMPTATPFPTITPTPIPPPPSPTPNAPATPLAPTPELQTGPFTTEVTEQQMNDYLAGKTFDQGGLTLRDIHVTLGTGEAFITLNATHQETGLSAGLTMRGVPQVVDGKAYLQITDVELDQSVTGLTRVLAQAAIEQAIKSYSSAQGIPIPADNVDVQSVQVVPGKIIISGIRK